MLIRIVEEQGEVTKIVGRGSKKKSYRSRSTSASSQDSFSSGSYTGNYKVISHRYLSVDLNYNAISILQQIYVSYFSGSSSDEDETTPRERIQKNSKGFNEFCVRRIEQVLNFSASLDCYKRLTNICKKIKLT